MPTPRPGQPVRGSTTGVPVMAAMDLFGRRHSLRIVWELREGSLGFRPLQQRCDGMSSSVLRQRLSELSDARLVEQLDDSSYTLTSIGRDAYASLRPLMRWAGRWSDELNRSARSSRTRR
jgi:DNA-binding HxlR family transcriptional regulator